MDSVDLTTQAKEFAIVAHGNQKYGDGSPYSKHLQAVVDVLIEFGHTDAKFIASAWLHDVIEDTKYSYQDIKKLFGVEIAEIVYSVTDELGRNRIERHNKTYPKTKLSLDGAIVKLADRIANTRASIADSDDKLQMYRREYSSFKEILYSQTNDIRWQELDRLNK